MQGKNYIIRFTSLCKIFTHLSFGRSFSVLCAPFSMLGGPGGTDSDEVHFSIHDLGLENKLHYSQFHRDRQALKMVHMAPKSFC